MNKKQLKIPLIARHILEYLSRRDEDFSITGDFAEEFWDKAELKGTFYARYWYWKQVLLSLPKIFYESFYWGMSMLKNYMKTALRNLLKYKGFSFEC